MCSAERYSDADWDVVESFLPEDWNEKARELGAMQRVRAFKNPARLLRTLLIHVGEGASFRDTSVRAKEGGLASVSDVALLKALRRSGPWLHWLAQAVMEKWLAPRRIPAPDGISRVRVVDGTTIQRPGATEATWRVHYSMELPSMLCDEVCITGPETGESLRLFDVRPGDLVMGDRGLAHRSGIYHVVSHGGDVLVRTSRTSIPFYDKQRCRFDVLGHLRTLKHHQIGDWEVVFKYEDHEIYGRICAVRKTPQATKDAQDKIRKQSGKKGRKPRASTLEAAGYTIVFTTLDSSISAETVLNIYGARWQVELVFKRLKSILGIGHLHATDPVSAKAWLHGKLLIAFLIEALKIAGAHFFPWGYAIRAEER